MDKEIPDHDFPEKRWRKSRVMISIFLGIFGVPFLLFLIPVILGPTGPRIAFAVMEFFWGGCVIAVRRTRHDEVVLNARDVQHSRWNRPLRFDDVAAIELKRIKVELYLAFKRKSRQKSFGKWGAPALDCGHAFAGSLGRKTSYHGQDNLSLFYQDAGVNPA